MENRRQVTTRDTTWAKTAARWVGSLGVKPNQISIMSILWAVGAGACLFVYPRFNDALTLRIILLIATACCIQLRLLCNLLDGMVAVEGGMKSKSGEIFNDAPDRLADAVILVGAGYATIPLTPYGVELGWLAGLLAVCTAYIRVLGASAGTPHWFLGPMAKQHRMAVLTLACLAGIAENIFWPGWHGSLALVIALVVICLGAIVTSGRRLVRIVRELEAQ